MKSANGPKPKQVDIENARHKKTTELGQKRKKKNFFKNNHKVKTVLNRRNTRNSVISNKLVGVNRRNHGEIGTLANNRTPLIVVYSNKICLEFGTYNDIHMYTKSTPKIVNVSTPVCFTRILRVGVHVYQKSIYSCTTFSFL